MDSIGQRLKEERKRLGYNQTDFAALGGVQKNAQSNYEGDARRPDADYLAAIAKLGADVAFIVTGVASPTGVDPEEQAVLAGYRALDARGRAGVLALIGGMQSKREPAAVAIKGDVSQVVHGDMTVSGPTQFTINKKSRK